MTNLFVFLHVAVCVALSTEHAVDAQAGRLRIVSQPQPKFWPHRPDENGHAEASAELKRAAGLSATAGRPALHYVGLAAGDVDGQVVSERNSVRIQEKPMHEVLHHKAHGHVHKTKDQVVDAPQKVPQEFVRDYFTFRSSFMPGWSPSVRAWVASLIMMVCGLIWLWLYLRIFYENDRAETLDRWQGQITNRDLETDPRLVFGLLNKNAFTGLNLEPDICIVFHHPTHEKHHGMDDIAPDSWLSHVLTTSAGDYRKQKAFKRFASLVHEGEHSDIVKANGGRLTKRLARESFLKDVWDFLPERGFEPQIFRSIDHDELFVCASLKHDRLSAHYIKLHETHLQIQRNVVAALGIKQPDVPHSSPPYIPYDMATVTSLYEAGVLKDENPKALYHCHHGRSEASEPGGSIVSGLERIRIIYRELAKYINLDAAAHQDLIVAWFPVHSRRWLYQLAASWADFVHLKDLTFVQPIPLLHNYFGKRVAFMFAWNGLYCKVMLSLVVVACVTAAVEKVGSYFHVFGDPATQRQAFLMGFTFIVITWSRVASNLWDVEEAYFLKLWDISADTEVKIIRPEFQGVFKPSDGDENVLEISQNERAYSLRKFAAFLISGFFCVLVASVIIMWLIAFSGKMNIVASIFLSAQILTFQFVFNIVAKRLSDWENHKYQRVYYNSYLWKCFILQFVNNYTAFFYLAVKQRYTDAGCPPGGCLTTLRLQLSMSLLMLSICRILQVAFSCLWVRYQLAMETADLRKQMGGEEPPKRSLTEQQAKYVEFRTQEQIEATSALMISLGFVLIFGAVCPIIIPCSFAVFVIQLRSQAFQLATSTKRPLPRFQFGIGAWKQVVHVLNGAGVIFASFLFITYAQSFDNAPVITKFTGALLFCMVSYLLWCLIDLFFAGFHRETDVLGERRRHIQEKIAHHSVNHDISHVVSKDPNDAMAQRTTSSLSGQGGSALPHGASGSTSWAETKAEFRQQEVDVNLDEAIHTSDWEVIPRLDEVLTEDHIDQRREAGRTVEENRRRADAGMPTAEAPRRAMKLNTSAR